MFIDCGHVLPPKNGSVVYPTGTTYDQTLAYSCDIGYNLVGDSNRTCQADGTWDLTDPYCQIRGEKYNSNEDKVNTLYDELSFHYIKMLDRNIYMDYNKT